MNNLNSNYGPLTWIPTHGLLLVLIILWTIFWKGLALWHAGRRNQSWWFVFLLIINSVGILDIIYLFTICKLKFSELFNKK